MGNTQENCSNCQKVASEAYQCGYEQAMNIYKEAIINCELQRPVVMKILANSVLIDKIKQPTTEQSESLLCPKCGNNDLFKYITHDGYFCNKCKFKWEK